MNPCFFIEAGFFACFDHYKPIFGSQSKIMTFIKKYFDFIYMVIITICLLLATENGYFDKLSKFAFVFLLGAYFIGKYVSRWQQKIKS